MRSYLSQLQCSLCSRVSVASFSTDLLAIPLCAVRSHAVVSRTSCHCELHGELSGRGVSWSARRTGTSRMRDVGCVKLYSSTTRHYPQNCKVKGALGRQSPPLIVQPHAAARAKPKGHVRTVRDSIRAGAGHVPSPFRIRGRHTARLGLGFLLLFSRAGPGTSPSARFSPHDFRLKFSTQHRILRGTQHRIAHLRASEASTGTPRTQSFPMIKTYDNPEKRPHTSASPHDA